MRILTKKRLAEHAKMGELMCSMWTISDFKGLVRTRKVSINIRTKSKNYNRRRETHS